MYLKTRHVSVHLSTSVLPAASFILGPLATDEENDFVVVRFPFLIPDYFRGTGLGGLRTLLLEIEKSFWVTSRRIAFLSTTHSYYLERVMGCGRPRGEGTFQNTANVPRIQNGEEINVPGRILDQLG